ncbi:MAG: metallophosphoesterase [Thermodesulfobacteriota bacterium]|nr:metallophosphoesterase [Thermodesulfobacteriota bacterium]
MESERVFIVGDIHGCLGMLKSLMDKIDWRTDKDRLIFIGDYIDRGEDPKGVVNYILTLLNSSPRVQCLEGNHEGLLLDFLSGGDINTFIINGGMTTLGSYGIENKRKNEQLIPPDHLAFFKNLYSWIELEDYYIVHAGFRPGLDIQRQSLEDLLWIRDSFIYSDYDFGKKVIFGHTPFYEPLIMDNKIGLDTGAVYGNKLTCLEIPSMKFHSVRA